MTLAETLRARREALGMSLSDAAAATGIARSYLYQLERGDSLPVIDKLQALARAYDTSVGALIGETEHPYTVSQARRLRVLERALDELAALHKEG